MEYQGHVKRGVIVLDQEFSLPEGIAVTVRLIAGEAEEATEFPRKSLLERMSCIAGKIDDLPSDFARNHDHYLHGTGSKH